MIKASSNSELMYISILGNSNFIFSKNVIFELNGLLRNFNGQLVNIGCF